MGWHWVGNQVLNHNCQRQGLLHLAIALPLLFGITAPNALAQSADSADVVSADLSYDGALWGIAKGQSAPTATWQNQAQLDLGFRLTPVTSSTTWRAHASVRWRNTNPDRDPGTLIGSTPLFDPSDWGAGTGARLMQVGIGMESKSLNLLAGWIQPQQHFLLQPLSKKVLNHAVLSAKGLGGNIPFVSSFSTWGALADWRSSSKSYIKAGTFMTYPEATESSNHGLWFGGNPNQPGSNRLMGLIETGTRLSLGKRQRPGLVAIGAYVYNGAAVQTNPSVNQGTQSGGYLQWDQQLWSDPKGTGRQIDVFSVLTASPAANNAYPLYGHVGLAIQGPFSQRTQDLLISTLAVGTYSRATPGTSPTSSLIAELGYQLALDSRSSYALYPFAQLVVRPEGTNNVPMALLAGISVRISF